MTIDTLLQILAAVNHVFQNTHHLKPRRLGTMDSCSIRIPSLRITPIEAALS